MELSTFINKTHRLIEAKEGGKRINQAKMSKRLGISKRTYESYWSGVNQPKSISAILSMLSQLEDEDVVKMINIWRERLV